MNDKIFNILLQLYLWSWISVFVGIISTSILIIIMTIYFTCKFIF